LRWLGCWYQLKARGAGGLDRGAGAGSKPAAGARGRGGSQGYLGVELSDVDQEKAQALKLKEVRGAVITLIDHDAPAGQIPLKINDVVLQLNGQNVEGAEQLRRMLREIPAGRKVSLEISRDGNMQTLTVELADRRKIEADAWKKVYEGGTVFTQAPEKGFLGGDGGGVDMPGGLPPGPFFRQLAECGRPGGTPDHSDGPIHGRIERRDGEAGGEEERGSCGRAEGIRRDPQGRDRADYEPRGMGPGTAVE
jgi:membrane-associated protease RseP (regulator of RpoE activity)